MIIKPIGKRVLVKVINIQEKTTSGILLVTSSNEKNYKTGEIIALSSDSEIQSLFKLNQNLIFSKKVGIDIENSGENYVMLDLEDILGIVEE